MKLVIGLIPLVLAAQSVITLVPQSGSATGEMRFRELYGSGANYVGFKAADSIAANRILTLSLGTAGDGCLKVTSDSVDVGACDSHWTRTGSAPVDLSPANSGDRILLVASDLKFVSDTHGIEWQASSDVAKTAFLNHIYNAGNNEWRMGVNGVVGIKLNAAADLTVYGHLLPGSATGTKDVGSSAALWQTGYFENLDVAPASQMGNYVKARKLDIADNAGATTFWDVQVSQSGAASSYMYIRDNGGSIVLQLNRIFASATVNTGAIALHWNPTLDNTWDLGGDSDHDWRNIRWQGSLIQNGTTRLDGSGNLTVVSCAGCGGVPVSDATSIVFGSADATKLMRFEVDGFTAGTTRVLTPQNASYTIAGLGTAQTFSADQTFAANILPSGTRDIGASGNEFNNAHLDNLYINGSQIINSSRQMANLTQFDMVGTARISNVQALNGLTFGIGTFGRTDTADSTLISSADNARFADISIGSTYSGKVVVIDSSRNASFQNLTVSGTCTGCGGFWSRSAPTLSPTTTGDIVRIPAVDTLDELYIGGTAVGGANDNYIRANISTEGKPGGFMRIGQSSARYLVFGWFNDEATPANATGYIDSSGNTLAMQGSGGPITIGGNITFPTDNTHSIGGLTSRPNTVRAGTQMQSPSFRVQYISGGSVLDYFDIVGGPSSVNNFKILNSSGGTIAHYQNTAGAFWQLAGTTYPDGDNTRDLGISGTSDWRSIYFQTSLVQNGTTRINSSGDVTAGAIVAGGAITGPAATITSITTPTLNMQTTFGTNLLGNFQPQDSVYSLGTSSNRFANTYSGNFISYGSGGNMFVASTGGIGMLDAVGNPAGSWSTTTGQLKLKASASFAVDAAVGVTTTVTVKGSDGNNCNLTLTGGIITGETCP